MLSLLQRNGAIHGSRATAYGASKYSRGNYFGPPPADVDPVDRFLGYIDAAMRHLTHVAHAINVAKGTGGDVRAACAVVDEDSSGGFPPSLLPHVSHAIAGLMIMVECGVTDGLLPADPGEPWKAHPMYKEVLARRAAGKPPSTHHGKSDAEIRAEQSVQLEPPRTLERLAERGLPQKDDPDAERARVEALRGSDRVEAEAHRRAFNVGDVVEMRYDDNTQSKMTIARFVRDGVVECVWFDEPNQNRRLVATDFLRHAPPEVSL